MNTALHVLANTGKVRCAKYLSHRSDLRSRTDTYNDSQRRTLRRVDTETCRLLRTTQHSDE